MAKVLLTYKVAAVKEIPLDKEETTIGRKPDNDIVIDNQAVSGRHASIKVEGDNLVLAVRPQIGRHGQPPEGRLLYYAGRRQGA